MRHSRYLLIDVSNSFTKLALASPDRLGRSRRLPTPDLTAVYLRRFFKKHRPDSVIVSSVVPEKNPIVRTASGKTPVIMLSPKLRLGVGIDYPNPKSIGADRLANAVAVASLYGYPAVVVDFGTAVTFDIVSENKSYLGGVIAPGLEAMTNFLYQRTALLPRLSLKEPRSAIGKSTIAAMRAGAVFGYRGLVREILEKIKVERFKKGRLHVVATGGYARLIGRQMPEIDAIHPDLTLEGLRIVANLNSGKSRKAGRRR